MASRPSVSKPGVRKSSLSEKMMQKILKAVPEDKVFHFYLGIDKPLDAFAVSLSDLFKKLEKVEIQSISFHQARGDFEKWIRDILGDGELALSIARIPESIHGESLRVEILREIRARLNDFRVKVSS